MNLPMAMWGLDDANFMILSDRIESSGEIQLAAIATEAVHGQYECRIFDLNSACTKHSAMAEPNLISGCNLDDLTVTPEKNIRLSRDDPEAEYEFWLEIELNLDDPGRWARIHLPEYPGDEEGLDRESLVHALHNGDTEWEPFAF